MAQQPLGGQCEVAVEKLNPLNLLHKGDVVLIKRTLKASPIAHRGLGADVNQTVPGFLCVDGLGPGLRIQRVNGGFAECGLDVREFLFVVIEQLSYTAQKDLQRRRKHLEGKGAGSGGTSTAAMQYLRQYEERARLEAQRNSELTTKRVSGPLRFGSIIQLQHLRSQQFVGVRSKLPAILHRTARRVELQVGSVCCWIRVNPAFIHKTQGEPVIFDEQVSLESTKLGDSWGLGSVQCKRAAGDVVDEVSCFKGDSGFFFMLYSRAMPLDVGSPELALGFGSVLRLFHSDQAGFLRGSCSTDKPVPYIRRASQTQQEQPQHRLGYQLCSKDIWLLELVALDRGMQDCGIVYNTTPVLLRHFGSGRYLSLSEEDLMDMNKDSEVPWYSVGTSNVRKRSKEVMTRGSSFSMSKDISLQLAAELVSTPGDACVFTLESTNHFLTQSTVKLHVPCKGAHVLLRWCCPSDSQSFWLGCPGLQKGQRDSLELRWMPVRSPKNAFRLDLLDEHPGLSECQAVAVHGRNLKQVIIPRVVRAEESKIPANLFTDIEAAVSDMIFFLAGSPHWQSKDKQLSKPDPLKMPWTAKPERQRFVRELKLVDATFELFDEMARHDPSLKKEEVGFQNREATMTLGTDADGVPPSAGRIRGSQKDRQARCLKLIVRLWLHSFLGCRENENYFHKRGWADTLDRLAGQGLGASDVFVALVSENPKLVRCIGPETMRRFIDFIRLLGPLDTWLFFLKALCAPQGQAVSKTQQDLLKTLVFRGHRASSAEQSITLNFRKELLIWVRLDESIGVALGRPFPGQGPPWEGCLSPGLLSKGIHDIAISWAYPEHWEPGKGALYHGPRALGLPRVSSGAGRTWVSLVQVAWVLQPARCCAVATGKTWQEVSAGDLGEPVSARPDGGKTSLDMSTPAQGEILKTLAKYFLAQLRLVADMVKAKQMNCIMALQEEYSFSLCVNGAGDARLPTSIRGAFLDILSNLWLNRHPHREAVVPNLLRSITLGSAGEGEGAEAGTGAAVRPDVWSEEHFRALPEEVHSFYRLSGSGKMEALLQVLRSHLCAGPEVEQQVHSAKDDNIMMLSVLHSLGLLLQFDFLHSRELLGEFLGPLLRCLDGRTDWLVRQGTAFADEAARKEEALAQSEVSVITPLLQGVQDQGQGRESGCSSSRSGAAPRAPGGQPAGKRYPPLKGSGERYLSTDGNQVVHDCKVQMLRVVQHMAQFAMDIRISLVMQVFRNRRSAPVPPRACVNEILLILDDPMLAMEQPQIRCPRTMLMDLLMYDNPEIFPLALGLLCSSCMRTSEFLNELGRVQLLSAKQAELARRLWQEVGKLGGLVYSFEIWGVDDDFSTVNEVQQAELRSTCALVRQLCSTGDTSTSKTEVQDMLRQTEFFSYLLSFLELTSEDFIPSCRPLLQQVQAQLCGAAAIAVQGNSKNQELLFDMAPNAARLVSFVPECAQLLSATFRGNLELCLRLPEGLVQQFGDLVLRERRAGHYRPWYLSFLCAVVAVGPVPVPRNQRLVIDVLQRLKPNLMLRLGDLGLDKLRPLAAAFRSEGQLHELDPRTWSEADGELIYYLYSMELLIGLGCGHGLEALTNKPFVNKLFPASEIIRLLLQVKQPRQTSGFSIYCRLRTRWLQLLHILAYNVEANLVDEELLASPVHVTCFQQMLVWIVEALDLVPAEEVAEGAPLLDEGMDEYVMALLHCVDAFFLCAYPVLRPRKLCSELIQATQGARQCFGGLVQQGSGRQVPRRGLQDPEFLRTIALRILSTTGAKAPWSVDLAAGAEAAGAPRRSSQGVRLEWQAMLDELRADPRVQQRLDSEQEELGQVFLQIGNLTDPEHPGYAKELPKDTTVALPDGWDFRRGRVDVEGILQRLMRHCQDHFDSDLPTLRRVLMSLLALIREASKKADPGAGQDLQMQFVQTGVPELLMKILDANLAADIEETSWAVLAEALQAPAKKGSRSLQDGLFAAIRRMDDSGLWESFQEAVDLVGASIKSMRALRLLPSLTAWEQERLHDYNASLRQTGLAMKVLRLMAEGHYMEMQDYMFSQDGNRRSVNVLNAAVWLLAHLCKDPAEADMANEQEFECVAYALELLTELAQGPNLRNQEFLSTLGLVEVVFKFLAAGFAQLQKAARDLYPPSVQRLKAQLVETLLALLEGRLDAKIHGAMLQRIDRHVLRERICFVYLYFVFGAMGVASGEVRSESNAAVPLDGRAQRLLLPTADPTELHTEVVRASQVAEELVEDLDDLELDTLFSEGLDFVQLCLELSPLSREFESEVKPQKKEEDPFVDEPSHYPTQNIFKLERKAYHKRDVYRRAFNFLHNFVGTIEVMLNGNLHNLHFQRPLTAMWYCSDASKQRILDTVPLSSIDTKMQAFVQMCREVHCESMLIRRLSRFSLLPPQHRKWAQRNLPDGLHRPFQIFLADDARRMQLLLRVSLCLSTALAVHVGLNLAPVPPGRQGTRSTAWVSEVAATAGAALGGLHFACNLMWLAVTACIKVPLNVQPHTRVGCNQYMALARAVFAFLRDFNVLWRFIQLICCGSGLFMKHHWLYSFLVTDCFCQNDALATVLRGIISPALSLVMTFCGMVLVTFVYAAFGFHSFRADFGAYCSDNILVCTANILYQGSRAGVVGLSSMMAEVSHGDPSWAARIAYDVSYFIIFGVMLLNAVVALVVDSFSTLRREAQTRVERMETETFISGLDRKVIDAAAQAAGMSDGFRKHEESKQNKWDYMSFIFNLHEKSAEDFTGPEQAIREMVEGRNIKWLPLGRSMMLKAEDPAEDALVRIARQTHYLERELKSMAEQRQGLFTVLSSVGSNLKDIGNLATKRASVVSNFVDLRESAAAI